MQIEPTTERILIMNVFVLVLLTSMVPGVVLSQECNTSVFGAEAAKLDLSKLESVSRLASIFEGSARGAPSNCAEKLFVEFRKLYYEARSRYEKHAGLNESFPMAPKREKELRAKLREVGWDLRETEGYYYIGESGAWVIDRFQFALTKRMLQYLTQRKTEIGEGFSEDAALLITWEKLRRRIAFWEDFLRQYQDFPLKDEVNFYLETYVRAFLSGTDNTQITKDYNDDSLRGDVKAAYEAYLRQNKSSRYYNVVEGYYEILKRNKFRVTAELQVFLDKQGIKSMQAVQPPLY
ncbi:MAG: hypothetical protein ACREI9_09795 [Nitrospiraceae bacterium]